MEQLLQYVWKHNLFEKDLRTTDGIPIEVLDVGTLNTDSGPDFFNSKIKIDGKIWVGNIEIHNQSNDWYRHNHNTNKAYNSVIMHIVENATCTIQNEAGETIPQCEIRYSQQLKENIEFLLHTNVAIPCRNYIGDVEQIHIKSWINSLLVERLERKANDIFRLLERFKNSWEETFYVLVSRSLGSGVNSDAFERLALSLPLIYIKKQGDNIHHIEALLFGQSGMLTDTNSTDEYTTFLNREYNFLRNKYQLKPLESYIFKNMRIRPTSSPQIRIAQLAALVFDNEGLFSKILKSNDIGQIRLLFHKNASEYWQTHYFFGGKSAKKSKYIGDSTLDVILINAAIPILFAYGKKNANEDLCEKAIRFLEQIKPESNFITRDFDNARIKSNSAYDSQALIQLRREYCDKKKCLYCRIGFKMLSENKLNK